MATPTCDVTALVDSGLAQAAAEALCNTINTFETSTNAINFATITDTLATQEARDEELATGMDSMFVMIAGAIVFFMHSGFAMLCAGAIRRKNTMNILLQTVLDACIGAICYYILGYGLAYGTGENKNGFLGVANFGLSGDFTSWEFFFLQWAFCATAATIPAGCVAERFHFVGYIAYTMLISGFVYPIITHWMWSSDGWLSPFKSSDLFLDVGAIDFAGCCAVHMVGGLSGFMGAWLVGPRMGRFSADGKPHDIPGHSATLAVLGTFLLWFGWYAFNPGSMLSVSSATAAQGAGRTAVTTTMSGAAGAVSSLCFHAALHGTWDLLAVCNGLLVGLVSITAGCSVIEPWAALIGGAIGAIIFEGGCILLLKLKIDDPLSASPMHGLCGAWGTLVPALFARERYMSEVYGFAPGHPYGLFYGGGGEMLGAQIVAVIVTAAWTMGIMGAFFMLLKSFNMLRISPDEEAMGLDASKHGGSAYNEEEQLEKLAMDKVETKPGV